MRNGVREKQKQRIWRAVIGAFVLISLFLQQSFNPHVVYATGVSPVAINVYGQGGGFNSSTSGTSASALNTPKRLAVDADGNLYEADSGNSRVLFFSANSSTATRVYGQGGVFNSGVVNKGGISASSLKQPKGLALDSYGDLYVADTGNNRVLFFPVGSTTATRVYGQLGSFTTATTNNGGISADSFNSPSDLALDTNNNLYVADSGNNRVLYYPAGSTTATRVYGQGGNFSVGSANNGGISADSLSSPYGVGLDNSNNLYISDFTNNRVLYFVGGSTTATRVYGQGGFFNTATTGTSSTKLRNPIAVRLDSSNNLYLADAGNNRVLYFVSGSTAPTRVYGQLGSFTTNTPNNGGISADSLNGPTGVALDSNNNLYVADSVNNRVLSYPVGITTASRIYDQTGSFATNTPNNGGITASSFSTPRRMALDSSGGFYVSDSANNRVLYFAAASPTASVVYGQAGSFTTAIVNAPSGSISATSLDQPDGLAVDSSGGLYISDSANNRVLYFASGSTTATRVYGQGSSGTIFNSGSANNGGISTTSLNGPAGIALDGSGNLYVADALNHRVLYYPSGSVIATRVYGQGGSFNSGTQNYPSGSVTSSGLNNPVAVTVDSSNDVYISDALNNRVLYYSSGSTIPTTVYGQGGGFTTGSANNGGISADSLSSPYVVRLDSSNNLYVSDSGNNRVLYYPAGSTMATRVYGQGGSFSSGSANNGGTTTASSLNNPIGIVVNTSSGDLYICDSLNNRLLKFRTSLSVSTQPPASVFKGTTFTVATSLIDVGSNEAFTDFTGTVTVQIKSGTGASGATLSGTTSVAAVNGVATFSTLSISPGGNDTYVLTFSSPNVGSVYSNTFAVRIASPSAIAVRGQGGGFTTGTSGGTSNTALFAPRRIAIDKNGNLYVADSSNNRVLYFPAGSPTATRVYGQGGSFSSNTANAGGISATSLNDPRGLALDSSGNLYIADNGNNRVLYFLAGSTTATQVYGQGGSFASGTANAGGSVSATSLSGPLDVALDSSNNLYVADSVNNRVLYYPASTTSATRVYGQVSSFTTGNANNGALSASSLSLPSGLALDSSGNLYIADNANNRVLYYPSGSTTATRVYGQGGSFTTASANSGGVSATSLNGPIGLVLDSSGNLYVADSGNNRVLYYLSGSPTATRVYGQLGSFITTTANNGGISSTSLSVPVGLALATSGNLYVADSGNNRVLYYLSGSTTATQVYGQDGSFNGGGSNNGDINTTNLSVPRGIALDSSGNLYVADSGNNRVLYYPAGSTTATRVYGQAGSFSSGTSNNGGISASSLSDPYGLALDSSGNLYVADSGNNRILYYPAGSTTATRVYGQAGSFTSSSVNNGGISATSLSAPKGVVLDSSGNLYIADSGNNRVLYYTSGSTTATQVYGQAASFTTASVNNGGISATSLSAPMGLALDSSGNLYIADSSNNRVLYYTSGSTTATQVYGQGGSFTTNTANNGGISATSLNAPIGLVLNSSGNLYVSDSGNNRVLYYVSGSTTSTRVYGQAGSFTTASANNGGISATSLSAPSELALDTSGDLYVADSGNNRVLYYLSGSTTATLVYGQNGIFNGGSSNNGDINATSLSAPRNVALDSSGDLYVADALNNRVLYYPAGSPTATRVYGQAGSFSSGTANTGGISATSLSDPYGLALDSSGNLYVADSGNNRVLYYPAGSTTATRVYGQAGSFTTASVNNGGTSATSLSAPDGLALDSSGDLYVADSGNNRVLYYTSGSTTSTRVYGQGGSLSSGTSNNGGISTSSLSAPRGVALNSSGNLYVADSGNNRVLYYPSGSTTSTRVYGQGGSFTTSTANTGGISADSLSTPSGLALDSSGNLYVVDTTNNRVLYYPSGSTTSMRVYGQNGIFTTSTINNGGLSSTSLSGPQGIAVDNSGDIYVADTNNNRVVQFQTSLSVTSQPPLSTPVGTGFSTAVSLIDVGAGEVFSDFTGAVTVQLKPGTWPSGATLSGTTTATAVNGVASFSGLSFNLGNKGYILTFSNPSVGPANTNPFIIVGPLLMTVGTAPSFTLTLNGTSSVTRTASWTFRVQDTGALGWHLALTSTQFSTAGGNTLPTTTTTITAASAACTSGQPCVSPTTSTTGYPLTVPAAATAPTPITFYNAALGTGTGDVTVTITLSVIVPVGSAAGTYTSTFTPTIYSGP